MNGLRDRLYPNGFRPLRYGVRLFDEANLNPHYWPFRGIALSLVVHASLLTSLITIPLLLVEDERPRFEEAVIIDADDLEDVLYLPLLGGESPAQTAENTHPENATPDAPAPSATAAKEGLSYPGPQPILSKFPVPTNHTQTILQPALKDPLQLDLALPLPNLVRLPPPEVLRKLTVPDAEPIPLQPPPMLAARPEIPLAETAQPLAAPSVDTRLKILDPVTSVARPAVPTIAAQLDPLSGPAGPLAAPRVESRLRVLDPVTAVARPSQPTAAQFDPATAAPTTRLAAPVAESRFRIPEQTTPIARPALPVAIGEPALGVSGPSKPLAAPVAESKIRVLDSVSPQTQPARTAQTAPLSVPTTDTGRALAAPVAESKIRVLDSATSQTQPGRATQVTPLGLPTTASGPSRPLPAPAAESKLRVTDSAAPQTQVARTTQVAPLNVPMTASSGRLAAPVAESKIKVADSATTTVVRPSPQTATPKLDVPMTGPTAPLAAPVAESRIRVPDSNQPLVALSPMPARRDQPVTVPAGEARGQFAISPQPNLTFPGLEPGGRGNASNTTVASNANNTPAGVVNSNRTSSGASSTAPGNSSNATPGAGANVFPGITILGAETASASASPSRNSTSSSTAPDKTPPPPLQTSWGISILASGATGGGLPDFGVFGNEEVHTVYLDMRRTIEDEPITWTVEFGVKQLEATAESERVATVGSRQEVILPFPIEKQRPVMSADLVRRYSGRLVIAYGVVNPEGKVEQLSIKQSPDPALNDIVLNTLRKWTFRPARLNGQLISAKILLGIPVRAD